MKILVIGGTIFVGRHFVDAAQKKGHEVAIFHRGNHPSPFANVREIIGDRMQDLALAAREEWDVVVDPSAYIPEHVETAAHILATHTKRYLLVSTISVYSDLTIGNMTEEAPLGVLQDPGDRVITGESYGPLKVLCEEAARGGFGAERTAIIRPGLVVGPYDPTGRFTYWVERIANGGKVLVPGEKTAPMQFIDARDLAEFMLASIEAERHGTVHATGPHQPIAMEALVTRIRSAIGSAAEFVWASEEFLAGPDGLGDRQVPFWAPRDAANMFRMDITKALGWGLKLRPLTQTIGDTWTWARETGVITMTDRYLSRTDEEKVIESVLRDQDGS